MWEAITNLIVLMKVSWDAGFYQFNMDEVKTYLNTWLESKGVA